MGSENYVAFNSISSWHTAAVSRIPFSKRQCYVENEIKLKYHSVYTRSSCMHECKIERIMEVCGCVPYYYIEGWLI